MYSVNDICSLDYLVGTLSTAYKGLITSLVVKDFCMTEQGKFVSFRGRVLSMPSGDYEASLIRNGVELARTRLGQGSFQFRIDSERVKKAGALQIDIIQSGRHIGTFLLKKESAGGVYISAIELSDELIGVDFRLLTAPLRNKVGLLHKAEEIITDILSTKKDWADFSERLNGFAQDFFWSDRNAFYDAFRILAHFSLKAAERIDTKITGKPIENYLNCIELPLEHGAESERERVRSAIDVWLDELQHSAIDLSLWLHRSAGILMSIHQRFPDADVGPVLRNLLSALRGKVSVLPALGPDVLDPLRNHMPPEIYSVLTRYGRDARGEFLHKLSAAENSSEQGMYEKVFAFLTGLDPAFLDDGAMASTFYDTVAKQVTAGSADAFFAALTEFFFLSPLLSAHALKNVISGVPVILDKLVSAGRNDLCEMLLGSIAKAGSPLREEIVMNPVIAQAVLRSGSNELIARYSHILTGIVIPAPRVRGISTETWAEISNPLHLERLAKFMDILQIGNEHFQNVLVHVIANLYVCGVFIPDDRLFQRRVSAYLNSAAMNGNFLLNYLFLQRLPVYYNEVGAVNRIRDYSTEIDSWGNDPVLYFVRKQVHVNASNYNIRLIEKIIASWVYADPSLLRDSVPPDVHASLKPELFTRHSAAIRPFFESLGVLDAGGLHIEKLIDVPEEKFKTGTGDARPDEIETKIMLLCRLYREVVKKYSFVDRDPERADGPATLSDYLDRMHRLLAVIRGPEKTAPQESLYFKRHIAFGIPSVLGTYHEPKFDAFGDFLRFDAGVRVSLEKTATGIDSHGPDCTKAEAISWLRILSASYRLLKLHGLENMQVEEFIMIIEQNSIRLSQVIDLLKMWQKELAWMVEFFNGTFHQAVTGILENFPREDLPDYLLHLDNSEPDYTNKAADILIRDMIASVPGLMEADRIIERLVSLFRTSIERNADDTLNEDLPEEGRGYFDIYDLLDRDAMKFGPVLGSKAKNLVYLHNRGFRVPAGVILSARLKKRFLEPEDGGEFSKLLRESVRLIEDRTGKFFGDPGNPLFLSVRSGSYVSMPGILSSILYCGMNHDTLHGFMNRTGDPRLGWDSYRRFIEHYSTAVLGLDAAVFDQIRNEFMNEGGFPELEALHAGDLETIVRQYVDEISRRGLSMPENVWEQLRQCVRAIFASWSSERAGQFRRATKASEQWGTSVTLMQMVYGNTVGCGASVFFTRNPLTREQEIYGETREIATGDELVYGRRLNRPLSKRQIASENAGAAEKKDRMGASLEETDPELFSQYRELAGRIEQTMGGLPQEVEVTYVRQPDGSRVIYVLQTRRTEFSLDHSAAFDEICAMESRIIGRGIGAHGGAVSGMATFAQASEQAALLSRQTGLPVILLRRTANTDDVSLMPVIGGIITSAGGVTSHAAVLAQKFDVNAVVACSGLSIKTNEQGEPYARIGNTIIKEGSLISIDGSTGLVFSGLCTEISNVRK